MSHRRTKEPGALVVRYGRGRVLAIGNASFIDDCPRLCRCLIDELAVGRGAKRRRTLRYEIPARYLKKRTGNLEVRYLPTVSERVGAFLRIARKVLPRLEALIPAKKPRKWRIELTGSPRSYHQWSWNGGERLIYIGAGASDAEMAFALGQRGVEVIRGTRAGTGFLWETVLDRDALGQFVGLAAMRWAGFGRQGQVLGEALEQETRRRTKGLDLARFYASGGESPGLWIWRELARRHGHDILARFFRIIPEKRNWYAAPSSVFGPLDLAVCFLSRAARTNLYPWFTELGTTVHPMPLKSPGTRAFKQGVQQYMRKLLMDPQAPASQRADAVAGLIESQEKDKRPLSYAARQLKSKSPGSRLVGAARLARTRDPRGVGALGQLARTRSDETLAGIAALLLVEQGLPDGASHLVKLTGEMDHRFQLDAGYQLEKIAHPRAGRFSLEGIARADGPSAARMVTRYRGTVGVLPTVDGQPVANNYSVDRIGHMPCNTHVSVYYVDWVHAAAKFRRKGLSRLAMARALSDARARRCSCAGLGTGTRNVAHSLYRSFGFVDVPSTEQLRRDLPGASYFARPKGVKVRSYRPGDETAMAKLLNTCRAESWACCPARPTQLSPETITILGHKGRKLVAYVTAVPRNDRATIRELGLSPSDDQQKIAGALIGKLHRELSKRGIKRVDVYLGARALAPILQPLGYRTHRHGGVSMFALQDLPQFLDELRPLLAHRLAKKDKGDYVGTVALVGEKHRAGLRIDTGRITVLPRPPLRPDIALTGADETVTKIVIGVETPFEAYLQLRLKVAPMVNTGVRDLLEALFPRLDEFSIWW
jgi:GNAT superfamily N-acetyltransferase